MSNRASVVAALMVAVTMLGCGDRQTCWNDHKRRETCCQPGRVLIVDYVPTGPATCTKWKEVR
jgi:hypothetical protein